MAFTTIDLGGFVLREESSSVDTVTAAGAGTLAAGTILARDSVSLKYVPFIIGGSTNQNGVPKGVLRHDVVATAAGDYQAAVLEKGLVNSSRLIVAADGDGSNITKAILDLLRDYGIASAPVEQLSVLDNQ